MSGHNVPQYDLVQRLRDASRTWIPSALLQAAADEITALRERVRIRDEQIVELRRELQEAYRGTVDYEQAVQ